VKGANFGLWGGEVLLVLDDAQDARVLLRTRAPVAQCTSLWTLLS
jgi:hypothetical protein